MQNTTTIHETAWGTVEGKKISLYTLTNVHGLEVKITNYGGIVTSIVTPDRHGRRANIVVGFNDLQSYLGKHQFFGALIGRYANRIANGRFTLEGKTYTLATNNGANHLHGGNKGFDKVVWNATAGQDSLTLRYLSADGEEGYPGNVQVTVTYRLTDDNELVITYHATTDKTTPINLTNHAYFNLTGDFTNSVLDHVLTLHATQYTPLDGGSIPTGELKPVTGTPFDFTKPERIGARIDQVGMGYDQNFVLDTAGLTTPAAVLYEPGTGRKMETYTTQPGLQFYTGNYLDGSFNSPDGTPFTKHSGLCLETQHFPDSPNKPDFPSTLLNPGETFQAVTRYKFMVAER